MKRHSAYGQDSGRLPGKNEAGDKPISGNNPFQGDPHLNPRTRIVRTTGSGKRRKGNPFVTVALIMVILVGVYLVLRTVVPSIFGPGPGTTAKSSPTTATGSPSTTTVATVTATAGTSTAASSAQTTPSGSSTTATTASGSPSTTVSPAARAQAYSKAKSDIESLVAKFTGRSAIYYQNLANGETYTYKAEQPFVAASSIKLGINTDLYTQIASGKISPTEMLSYDSRAYPTGDYEAGTGTIQYQPNGTRYSVRDTSGLSIRISDNCATNMVIRKLGGIDTVNVFLKSISSIVDYRKTVSYTNYAGTSVSGRHRTCATDLGLHAVKLYQLFSENPKNYQPLIDDLCKTEFNFGIQKGIPTSIKVAHKIGTNGTYNTENDVGIVFADEPFVLCVMTESGNASTAHQFQADVARILFQYVDSVT